MKDNGNMNSEIRSDAAVPKTPAGSAVLPLDSSRQFPLEPLA